MGYSIAVEAIFSNIDNVNSSDEVNQIYEKMKDHVSILNQRFARHFKLDQKIKFISDKNGMMKGRIESIGRTGRVKIKLIDHYKYDSYTTGASRLFDTLKRD